MSYTRGVAVAVSAAALALPAGAAAEGSLVFNFGQCVQSGFPAPSNGDFGPLILVFNPNGVVFNVPPGLQEGPATNPQGQIACPVATGNP